ncbi:MAG: discoidin domain-containing protein [Steroidobacteraceae bacterium]
MAGSAVSVPLTEWQPTASGNAEIVLSAVATAAGPALRMDFDFKGGKGFVVARRAVGQSMPAEYAVHFRLRGHGAVNDLELKLIDSSGQNVWRHVLKGLSLPQRWKRFVVESRDVDFAWGPASGGRLLQLGFIEFAVVAGEGGAGSVFIADLEVRDLTPARLPSARASSAQPGFSAEDALTGGGWKPRSDDRKPWIAVDCSAPRRLGGLIIDWLEQAPANGYRVRASLGGKRWKTVYTAAHAGGKRSYVYLPGLSTRIIRLEIDSPCAGASLRLEPFEFSRSIEAFWYALAAAEARGWHPRWLHREQSEWTPIGTSHGRECALMNADGMVEVRKASFSLEPMLFIAGRLFTWADVEAQQSLEDRWTPVPTSIWDARDWRLSIAAEATVSGTLRIHYRLQNRSQGDMTARLFVLLRPFQVTPPWQSFRNVGGVSRVQHLAWDQETLRIDERTSIAPTSAPTGFGAMTFDEGPIAASLAAGLLPPRDEVQDVFGFASGAFEFALSVEAQQTGERVLECRPAEARVSPNEAAFDWKARISAQQWSGAGWCRSAVEAALTATTHILVTRSGAALQPGPRRYTRSWIRDGAMMSAALLRMGHAEEVAEFIRWYAPHQRADGFVPCCVDSQGPDWLVEHDSHGELIALIADHYRFTGDKSLLTDTWIFVERALGCIEVLLESDGLLPISVSHEGYLAQPVHSYWDDFWALRGVTDAADLARALGRNDVAARATALAARLARSLFASIEATRARRGLDFIPGSVEWADFDPTATANALYLFDVPDGLDRAALERTFDKYLADWRAKRSGEVPAPNYTPYEIRIIGALVRLGRRDAALELLRFFLSDRRPPAWNQWPEIAWRDRKAPAHVGDLPHTWISAEYVLALRSLFAYELESRRSLVLAAGLSPEWIEGAGVEVKAMPTLYGPLSYSLRQMDARTLRFDIAKIDAPLIIRPPHRAALHSALVNGSAVVPTADHSIEVAQTPAEVICVSS